MTAQGDGEITSGTFSPTLNCSIAFARLPAGVTVGDRVQVDLRGKPVAVDVVSCRSFATARFSSSPTVHRSCNAHPR
jgi:glycine cleavage system aminomethyltransferase T